MSERIRISKYEQDAVNGMPYNEKCCKEVIPFISNTFEKIRSKRNIWEISDMGHHVEEIAIMIRNFACNTHEEELLSNEEIISVKKIFNEIDILLEEILNSINEPKEKKNILKNKLECISKIIYVNMLGNKFPTILSDNIHDGKMFQSYEHLYLAIYEISRNWDSLVKRGFSSNIIDEFWKSFKYDRMNKCEKSEDEKFNMFIRILDGSMKFHPIYEAKAVAFAIVSSDFNDEIIKYEPSSYTKGYGLKRE